MTLTHRTRQCGEQDYQDPEEGEEAISSDEDEGQDETSAAVGEEELEDRMREVHSLNSVHNYRYV